MRRTELVEKRDILLFDILLELKSIRAVLSGSNISNENLSKEEEKSEPQPAREAQKPIEGVFCKHCGNHHAKPIDIVNCGRRKMTKG